MRACRDVCRAACLLCEEVVGHERQHHQQDEGYEDAIHHTAGYVVVAHLKRRLASGLSD